MIAPLQEETKVNYDGIKFWKTRKQLYCPNLYSSDFLLNNWHEKGGRIMNIASIVFILKNKNALITQHPTAIGHLSVIRHLQV